MKTNALDVVGYVDDPLIEKAEAYTAAGRSKAWAKWAVLAACIALILAVTAFAREANRYNAAVEYLRSMGIPAKDLSDYSRKEIKDAAQNIAAGETSAVGESGAWVDENDPSAANRADPIHTPAKITSAQIRKLEPTMTRAEVLAFLGDTLDIGSGIHIYVYEVDQAYHLCIPFAGSDAQLGVTGEDLLHTLEPME